MDVQQLQSTAQALVAEGKGILAADESDGTIKKRFDSIGVESNDETRRAYRDLLFTTEGVEEYRITPEMNSSAPSVVKSNSR